MLGGGSSIAQLNGYWEMKISFILALGSKKIHLDL